MRLKEVRLIGLDECPRCRGIWFDRQEFDRAVKILTGSYSKAVQQEVLLGEGTRLSSESPLPCPACESPMDTYHLEEAGIDVDHCPRCQGLWLDGGEFETLKGLVERGRVTIPEETLQDIRDRPVESIGTRAMGDLAQDFSDALLDPPRPPDRTSLFLDLLDLLLSR